MTDETSHSQNEKGFLAGFLKFLPAIQWLVMIVIAASVFGLSQRDSQTAQAMDIRANGEKINNVSNALDKQIELRGKLFAEIKGEMLTKELFEAYHKNDAERMDRMEKLMERLLNAPNRDYAAGK